MPKRLPAVVALALAAIALTGCGESTSEYRLRLSIECHEAGGSPSWERQGYDTPIFNCSFPELKP